MSKQAAIVDFLQQEEQEGNDDDGRVGGITFKPATVTRVLTTGFSHQENSSTKMSKDAVLSASEYLVIMTREAIHRSFNHCQEKNRETGGNNQPVQIQVEDLQAVAGSIVLDF